MDWTTLSAFTLALIAIMNPLGKIPPWLDAIGSTEHRIARKTAFSLTLTAAIILAIFFWFGKPVLSFFDIDLASFRIAGGLILISVGFNLLQGKTGSENEFKDGENDHDRIKVKRRFRRLVVPIAVPLIAGPGSIITVTIFGIQLEEHYMLKGTGTLILALILLVMFVLLNNAGRIKKVIGYSALTVQGRLFGLILIAIGCQLLVEGVGAAFPELIGNNNEVQSTVADEVKENSTSAEVNN